MGSSVSRLARLRSLPSSLWWITAAGAVARLIYLAILPPIWKLGAAFNVFEFGLVPYVSNFAGYKPSRMPFFDVLSAAGYAVFSPLLGLKSLIVFNVVLAVLAIPVFYLAVSRVFSRRVAIPASLLFALYPKFVLMTSNGMPEAAAISFVAFAFYALVQAFETGHLRWYGSAGVLATIAFLMFVPAVAVGVLFALAIYVKSALNRRESAPIAAFGPTKELLTYVSVPSIVGVLYLIYGPILATLSDVSTNYGNIFVEPEAYSVVEKIFWFLAYTFFDFWWHTRGFDRERGIRPLIESLQGFFGPGFPVYILGWAAITIGLTILVFVGLGRLGRQRRGFDLLFLAWIVGFVGAYLYKNLGWIGGFQTRHVSPVFPALCIAFGVGAAAVSTRVSVASFDLPGWLPEPKRVLWYVLVLCLVILLINGAAQGVLRGEKRNAGVADPMREVTAIVGDDRVGVLLERDFHTMTLYSENRVRPTILTDSQSEYDHLSQRLGETAELQLVEDPLLRSANVEYVYLRFEPQYVDRMPYTVNLTRAEIDRLISAHETVYHKEIPDGAFRTTSVEIYLLKLDSNRAG